MSTQIYGYIYYSKGMISLTQRKILSESSHPEFNFAGICTMLQCIISKWIINFNVGHTNVHSSTAMRRWYCWGVSEEVDWSCFTLNPILPREKELLFFVFFLSTLMQAVKVTLLEAVTNQQ